MIKKAVYYAIICLIVLSLFVSCADKPPADNSSHSVSSAITSSEIKEEQEKVEAWGDPNNTSPLLRPSFLAPDAEGNLFYCDDEGSIYKQLVETNGLSKLYSSSGYDFVSVQYISENLICAGYKNKAQESGYIIFDLKDKTVNSAVSGDEFKGKSIYSLVYYNEAVYFLTNPDRYGRFTLYRQTKDATQVLSHGVNEFVIYRNKLFYNVGGYIYSANVNGSDAQMLTEVVTNDFLGFTLAKDSFFYMSTEYTYRMQIISGEYDKFNEKVKVYTSASNSDYTFFCGTDGGIYLYSHIKDELKKVSEYTADEMAISGDYLYLKPADPLDYPNVPKEFIVQNNVHRFKISELIESASKDAQNENSTVSSSLSSGELVSSNASVEEEKPLAPENFGR